MQSGDRRDRYGAENFAAAFTLSHYLAVDLSDFELKENRVCSDHPITGSRRSPDSLMRHRRLLVGYVLWLILLLLLLVLLGLLLHLFQLVQ
jgi:hypothetical protein